MEILQARVEHLADLSTLFDQYRVFYQALSDYEAAQKFLEARLQNGESAILVAIEAGTMLGFTQLYPSFSSVSMQRIWILNDLFVAKPHRGQGIAKALMNAAAEFARKTGAIRLDLATQATNKTAQSLYESLGYCKDEVFYHYSLTL